jgi:hypothetical protein
VPVENSHRLAFIVLDIAANISRLCQTGAAKPAIAARYRVSLGTLQRPARTNQCRGEHVLPWRGLVEGQSMLTAIHFVGYACTAIVVGIALLMLWVKIFHPEVFDDT